ncbi:hypothetical protein [Variovorax sp. DT-64]|uniref:hypothetical protein n=1 Tax=Variovorax sp. DT-64 TaxID=3396160 RepID=UPI003F1A0149
MAHRFASLHAVSVEVHVGSRLPAYCGAAARALVAAALTNRAGKPIGAVNVAVPSPRQSLAEVLRRGMCRNC